MHMVLSWPVNTSAQQWTDMAHCCESVWNQNPTMPHYTKTSSTVYLCQINIEALGERPHRGQVANNQTCIFVVHSIRIHPEINYTC